MKINLSKTYIAGQQCLIPAYQSDKELMDQLTVGEIVRGEIKKERNPKFHAKFMAMLRMVVANTDKWSSVEHLLTALKYSLGLVDLIQGVDGRIITSPKSISFEKMDNQEFEKQVYNPSLKVLAEALKIDTEELETNYGEYL